MNSKMKSCFTPHIMMHSMFALGLGILLASQVTVLNNVWLGVVLMVFAVLLDSMRKS